MVFRFQDEIIIFFVNKVGHIFFWFKNFESLNNCGSLSNLTFFL